MKKTFDQWFAEVNVACKDSYGLSINDLPDCPFQDWFAARMTAKTAAKKAWKLAQE